MPLILGVDIGTSSAKALLMDENGEVLAKSSSDYPLYIPQPQWVEQNPEDWWNGFCSAVRGVWSKSGVNSDSIKAVALSGQMNGAIFVDRFGKPMKSAIIWLDNRATHECQIMADKVGDELKACAFNPPQPVYTAAKVLWVMRNEPQIWRNAYKVLLAKDYINLKLTGNFFTEFSDASATLMFDLKKRRWAYETFEKLGVRGDILPEIVESTSEVGKVTPEAAQESGLKAGTSVLAGGADMACMAIGGGVVSPGVVSVTIGTAGHVTAFAEYLRDEGYNKIYPMCHAVPNSYFWLGCVFSGGVSLQWFRDVIGEVDYEILNTEAKKAQPGCEGLFFLPWLAGCATPHADGKGRGCFIGLTLRHKRSDLIRAIMEGVAYNLRDSLEVFEELGIPIREVRIGEGGSKSAPWRQIQADIFNRDVKLLQTEDASPIGAALIAAVGSGSFKNFEEACKAAISLGDSISPNPQNAEFYERGYRIYQRFYERLKDSFDEIVKLLIKN